MADASQHIVKVDGETANTLSTPVDGYRIDGGLETKYVGPDTATVTEAIGRFAYSEEWHDDGNHNSNEVAIYGAFGGTK